MNVNQENALLSDSFWSQFIDPNFPEDPWMAQSAQTIRSLENNEGCIENRVSKAVGNRLTEQAKKARPECGAFSQYKTTDIALKYLESNELVADKEVFLSRNYAVTLELSVPEKIIAKVRFSFVLFDKEGKELSLDELGYKIAGSTIKYVRKYPEANIFWIHKGFSIDKNPLVPRKMTNRAEVFFSITIHINGIVQTILKEVRVKSFLSENIILAERLIQAKMNSASSLQELVRRAKEEGKELDIKEVLSTSYAEEISFAPFLMEALSPESQHLFVPFLEKVFGGFYQ